jgi:STE24 endopeptidase
MPGGLSFLDLAVGGTAADAAWNAYLQHRQARAFSAPYSALHPSLQPLYSKEQFDRAQAYSRERARFAVLKTIVDGAVEVGIYAGGVLPKLFDAVGRSSFIAPSGFGGLKHCLAWGAALDTIEAVVAIPWEWYSTFCIEQRHGFNRTTPAEFIKDRLKMLLLKVCVLRPLISGMVQIVVTKFGPRFPLFLTIGSGIALTLSMFIIPNVIMPLFNKFTPLAPDHPVRKRIEALAERVQFPLKSLYEMDGSRRTAHSNAFFYGFGSNKRIVVFDTLLKTHADPTEIEAIVAHELGHWQHSHMPKNFAITLGHLFALFQAAAYVIFKPQFYHDFGFKEVIPVVGFDLFSTLWRPVGEITGIAMSRLSRSFEFQADAYAVRLGYYDALKRGLITIHDKNASGLTPDPLYTMCRYSHPPLAERLSALDALNAQKA